MPSDAADLAARLLDAHVDYERRRLTDPAAFAALVQEEITAFLDVADQLPLEEAVSRDLVKAVARKYAIAFPVDGAIPELVGTVAARLYEYSIADDTRLGDVLDRRRFEELASGVAELGLSRRVVQRVLDSPATEDACVEAVQRAVDTTRLPERIAPAVDSLIERIARRGARTVLAANSAEADHLVLDAAREVWLAGADQSVRDVRDVMSSSDVEDAVVLVFEFWRTFRETPYFESLLAEGVDEVFDTYGGTALAELLDELGIGRDDLVEEAMRFGPPVIARVDADGFVEAALRRRLGPFYASAEFASVVDG
ncbi:hypothetical protein [Gordonia neofelifaecis]|uniref:Uncharacterized protein n=1 Tax=Gordonia neofelifaecis NRRL B-59395 TaxID=644548 RepID=F1YEF8_9ACTN|nr:hypothetical protein [Gordonia neofelifaecis]EGD56791.1 hypothetical protein SCNU_00395 [Gordonia neofelifaecis NRRL B-59395]